MIFLFSDLCATQAQVGGKGYSLIKMTGGGFPVPEGMILSVGFFDDWLRQLAGMKEFRLLSSDTDDILQKKTKELQREAGKLCFTDQQRALFDEKLRLLHLPGNQLYSVRSSSPDEDMTGASFAGMYETYLGVDSESLEERIRDVFVSCIDYRVVVYKRQKGFDFTTYSIAVVVMAQIRSEVAGVAFSINPLNNSYDEVVINANFGLGESVVSGETVPDQFLVDKYRNVILESRMGEKKVSILIGEGGGTHTITGSEAGKVSLSDPQILELASIVKRVEDYYGMPMDTEWAWADNRFYMLQARPITTYVPLHPVFMTPPGAPKKLYLDLTLVEQGIQKPLSVMGTDCFRMLTDGMGISAAGIHVADKPGDIVYGAGGRVYINLSADILMEGKKSAASAYEGLDSYAARIIREVDMKEYKASVTPRGVMKVVQALFVAPVKSFDLITGIMKGMKDPEKLRDEIDRKGEQFMQEIDRHFSSDMPFAEFVRFAMQKTADLMIHTTIPSLLDGQSAKKKIRTLLASEFGETLPRSADLLDRGLPYNITMEMNSRVYSLMAALDRDQFSSTSRLLEKIRSGEVPQDFLYSWNDFMKRFGFRGPGEVDIATPRYRDDPMTVLNQMKSFSELAPENSPQSTLAKQVAEREKAFTELLASVNNKKKLRSLYNVLVNLGGYREIHKYYLVYAGEKIRRRALAIASALVEQKRIESVVDVFFLTTDELQHGLNDPTVDMQQMIACNKAMMAPFQQVVQFPPVMDSRGRILRPNRPKPSAGEIFGDPVSAGKVTGKAVIISFVGEKTLQPGDILVAKSADPGWTPLFINASGILLEVGGMLQHGSLIAREYGKPCIAGIEGLTNLVKDGDLLEMDGSTGVVIKKHTKIIADRNIFPGNIPGTGQPA